MPPSTTHVVEATAPRGCFANGGSKPPRLVAIFFGIFNFLRCERKKAARIPNELPCRAFIIAQMC